MEPNAPLFTVDDAGPRHEPDLELTRLSLLYQVSRSFGELIEIDDLIPFVIAKTKELLRAESSAILLLDERKQELYFPYSADVTPAVEERFAAIRFPADRGIAGWVLQHGVPQLIPDVSRDERWYAHVDRESGMVTSSLLCAPLRTRRGSVGVIELRNKLEGQFTPEDLSFLDTLAGSIAVAIENARLYDELKKSEARLRDEVVVLNREMASRSQFTDIVGTSDVMQRVFQLTESAITTPVTVLLQGETGTGKELIARAIHYNGLRQDRPFVAVNCGALSEALLESELFGHKRGAFTGAIGDRKGLFEVANGGTIFLDEVGETTPGMQVKLLRVLQNGEIVPVGETAPRFVDVRVISATNRDLEEETRRGTFRADLYYRLSTFPISVPPLRMRREDIPILALHLLQRVTATFHKPVPGISPAALDALIAYAWPGNVRDLENEIKRAVALVHTGAVIQPMHLSERLTASPARAATTETGSLRRARDKFEEQFIANVLQQHAGNASQAAKALGISRVMLQKKISSYGLRRKIAPPTR